MTLVHLKIKEYVLLFFFDIIFSHVANRFLCCLLLSGLTFYISSRDLTEVALLSHCILSEETFSWLSSLLMMLTLTTW